MYPKYEPYKILHVYNHYINHIKYKSNLQIGYIALSSHLTITNGCNTSLIHLKLESNREYTKSHLTINNFHTNKNVYFNFYSYFISINYEHTLCQYSSVRK